MTFGDVDFSLAEATQASSLVKSANFSLVDEFVDQFLHAITIKLASLSFLIAQVEN
jgi:hypothetical protein